MGALHQPCERVLGTLSHLIGKLENFFGLHENSTSQIKKKKKVHRNQVPTPITEISDILVKLQTELNPIITQGNNP